MPPFQFVLRGDALLPSRSEVARGAAQIASTLAVGFTLMPNDAMFSVMHTDPHCKGIVQQPWVMFWMSGQTVQTN